MMTRIASSAGNNSGIRPSAPLFLFCFLFLFFLSPTPICGEDPRYPHSTAPLPEGDLFAEIGFNVYERSLKAVLSIAPYTPPAAPANGGVVDTMVDCEACLAHFVDHFLKEMRLGVADACAAIHGETVKNRCEWVNQNENALLGYLIGRVDPMRHGFTYCAARASCSTANSANIPFQLDYSHPPADEKEYKLQLASSYGWLQKTRHESHSYMIVDENGFSVTVTEDQVSAVQSGAPTGIFDVGHLPTPEAKCHSCLNHGVRWAMRKSVRHVKHECATAPEKSNLRNWCIWTGDWKKRDVIRGILYSFVQPFKTAIGWCVGKELCSHAYISDHLNSIPFTMKGSIATREAVVGEKLTRENVKGAKHERRRYH